MNMTKVPIGNCSPGEGHLVCFSSKESNGRATEGVATKEDTDGDNYSIAPSNVQGDSGGVLMMQEKSGRRRWIQVFFEKHEWRILNQTHWEPWPLTHLELSLERWGFMPM